MQVGERAEEQVGERAEVQVGERAEGRGRRAGGGAGLRAGGGASSASGRRSMSRSANGAAVVVGGNVGAIRLVVETAVGAVEGCCVDVPIRTEVDALVEFHFDC